MEDSKGPGIFVEIVDAKGLILKREDMKKFIVVLISIPLILTLFCTPPDRTYRHLAKNFQINEDAMRVATASVKINAPLDRVWDIAINAPFWTSWHPEVTRVKAHKELEKGDNFIMRWGAKMYGRVVNMEDHEKILLEWTALSHKALMLWTFDEPEKGVVEVTVTESRDGFFQIFKLSEEEHHELIADWVNDLKIKAEQGD